MKTKKCIIYSSLILLALVTLVSFIMGTNALTLREATIDEKENEKTFVKTTAALSRGENPDKKVDKDTLAQALDKYVGEGKTTVTQKSSTRLLVKFLETGNEYEIEIATGSIAYTITYEINGGEGEPPEPQTKYDGIDIRLSNEMPLKTDYLFVGWNTDPTATTAIYEANEIYSEDSSITLYAIYSLDIMPVTYHVDVDKTYSEYVLVGRTTLTPRSFTPEKPGYTFKGWREDGTANGDVLTSKIQERTTITLYAVFEKNVKATYVKNDTTSETKKRYYNNGTVLNPTFTLPNGTDSDFAGWTWRGWSDDGMTAGNATVKYDNGGNVTIATDSTFYGLYSQSLTQTFTSNGTITKLVTRYFNASGNHVEPTVTFPAGGEISGWTWLGWSDSGVTDAGAEVKYANGDTITVTTDNTFYGLYTRTLTQTFISNGTVAQTGTRYYNASGNYINPTATFPTGGQISGWTWLGWSDSGVTTGNAEVKHANGETITVTDNNTFYGLYNKSLTQTFISNGTTTQNVTRYYNAYGNYANPSVTFPTGGTYSGWTWRGWGASGVTTANAEVKYTNGQTVTVAGDNTFYGLHKQTITLSYNGNGHTGGSTAAQTGAKYFNAAGNYMDPTFSLRANGFTKTGYKFVKWDKGNPGASITLSANATAKATWEKTPTIGDYVNYTPASFNNYTVQAWQSGYRRGNETYYGSRMRGIKWRILRIQSNGVIQLVSEPFGMNGINTDGHHFEGPEGYTYGASVLNAICSTVLKTNTNVATGTRSLSASDINTLVGYTPSGNYAGYTYGRTYGSRTHTYYNYYIPNYTNDSSKLSLINDFFNREWGIWLTDQYVRVRSSNGSKWDRGLLFVTEGSSRKYIDGYGFEHHNDSGNYSEHAVAAVVTLKAGINLTATSSSTRTWNIN